MHRHPATATPTRPAWPACGRAAGTPVATGFTLVEAMIVLAVLTVVLAVGMPSMQAFVAGNAAIGTRSAFTGAVALARSEAARRGLPVLLQARASGPTGNEYAQGWELVADTDGDGQAGQAEPRVRVGEALGGSVRLGGPSPLVFRGSGALAAPSDQVFTVCPATAGAGGYTITITPSGQADVATRGSCP